MMATTGRDPRAPTGEVDVDVGGAVDDVLVRVEIETLAKVVVVGLVVVEDKVEVGNEVVGDVVIVEGVEVGVAEVGGGVKPP